MRFIVNYENYIERIRRYFLKYIIFCNMFNNWNYLLISNLVCDVRKNERNYIVSISTNIYLFFMNSPEFALVIFLETRFMYTYKYVFFKYYT